MAKKLMKAQDGKALKSSNSDRVKDYEKSGWKKDNVGAVKKGYSTPKDTVSTQWMSNGKELVGIVKDKTKKFATGGIIKNKTLYPAGAGLMKKGGSMKTKKK